MLCSALKSPESSIQQTIEFDQSPVANPNPCEQLNHQYPLANYQQSVDVPGAA